MVDMAKPWKHPQTGTYYLRRQIPAAIRAAFGGQQLHKVALGTKDPKQAAVLFLQANAELEIRFDEARSRLKATGSPLPSSRDRAEELIGGYFNGPEHAPGALDGAGRLLLARLEIDRGLWNDTETGCSPVPESDAATWQALSDNAARFRNHSGARRHLLDHAPGAIWRWGDEKFRPGARQRQLERLVARVAYYHGVALDDLPPELAEVLTTYLDALPVGTVTTRKARQTVGRLRPDLRLMELFDEWQLALAPSLQSAAEYRSAARDFIDLIGDIAVVEITNDDLLDFRDATSKLPVAMPKADRQLPFTKRVAKQEWGAMARADHGAFYAHFARVLAAEPVPPVGWGYTLEQDPVDKRRLVLWELFAVPGHPPRVVAWERHYGSAREAGRTFRWLNAADNLPEWQAMAEVAAQQGPSAVDIIVDRAVTAGRWC